ncbi:3-deoxy-manno-octulosonate cytidylyltransferase [Neorhizobium sp. IRS_2294]|uniref:3-deoxy-manno-octulosonate cytidylyltransferase n=1 Tax=unclassified Neorhizobium TaxID=2629175 RepID=UPI003D2672B3
MTELSAGMAQHRPTTSGLMSEEDWQQFFAGYSHIVLVANSDEQNFNEIHAAYPETTLFVFFNYVSKVLKTPFTRNSLLVARTSRVGSELIYDNALDKVLALLPGPGFTGVMSMRAATMEQVTEPAEFGGVAAGAIDLCSYLEDFYPRDHTASSGFALSVWLCEKVPQAKVVLCGFSGRRSRKWQMFHIHDWTFEQSVLQLLANSDKLEMAGRTAFNPYKALSRHFPDIDNSNFVFAAIQVLSERLENSNRNLGKLITITMPLRVIYNLARGLRIRSKKDRLVKQRKKQRAKNGEPS